MLTQTPQLTKLEAQKYDRMFNMFDGTTKDYLMRNNGFFVGFNSPPASKEDDLKKLPPYAKRRPYLVDEYPACPKGWMRSEGKTKSYFVGIEEGHGMWLDLNYNADHKHHIAVVISVQGVNPITGMPCKDAQLEQYIEECPKHNKKFGPDRFCEECGYHWPKQNYLCTNATPLNYFWLDGFRSIEGIVKQYIFTEQVMKGVASNIIGKDRVFAIGLSFFISKDKKPEHRIDTTFAQPTWYSPIYAQPQWFSPVGTSINWQVGYSSASESNGSNSSSSHSSTDENEWTRTTTTEGFFNTGNVPTDRQFSDLLSLGTPDLVGGFASGNYAKYQKDPNTIAYHSTRRGGIPDDLKAVATSMVQPTRCSGDGSTQQIQQIHQTKKYEVGQGAQINQQVHNDTESLDYWKTEYEAMIVINYASIEDAAKILEAGKMEIKSHKDGFLKDIPSAV